MNRQYGRGSSKYVVILDPLLTGHVTRSMLSKLLAFNMGKCNFEASYFRNGARQTPRSNGPPIGNHICRDQWSRDRWRHV